MRIMGSAHGRLILIVLLLSVLCAPNGAGADTIDGLIADMSLHEKVCQLFFVQPEQFSRIDRVTAPSNKLRRAFERFPVGGIILFPENMKNAGAVTKLTGAMQEYAVKARGIGLLIGADEEGGGVSRVAAKLKLAEKQPYAAEIGATGDRDRAREMGSVIGGYLKPLGFNLDFAPVCDVRAPVKNAEIKNRAFSDDAETAARMAAAFAEGLMASGVMGVAKHFPGHGAVSGNTHGGPGISKKTPDEWRAVDLKPFQAVIDGGIGMVMISHQVAPDAGIKDPASLSPAVVTGLLRGEMGYDGVVITDALRMAAVRGDYGTGRACVMALEAGCDMLLLPYNFTNAYNAVMKAVKEGRLTEERIDRSVRRVLQLKYSAGLITGP